MSNPAQIGLRGTRAAVFGTSTLVLAAAAHVLVGGTLPSVPVLLAVGAPVACASVVLARRTRRLHALLAFLALGQVLLHEAFTTASAGPVCDGGAVTISHAGHATALPCGDPTAMPMAMSHHGSGGALMVLAHALAVVAVALLLAHGERTAMRLWGWVRPRVTVAPVRVPVLTLVTATFRSAQLVPRLPTRTDVTRRGPPARPVLVPVFA